MNITFDAESGRLRLDQAAFDRLVAWGNGDRTTDPGLAPLVDAGVVVGDGVHPSIAPALAAVSGSLCRLHIELTDDHGASRAGDGWVAPGDAALLLDVDDGVRDLVVVHPTLLPAVIARLTRLGPHSTLDGDPLQVTGDLLGNLLSTNASDRSMAAGILASQEPRVPLSELVDDLATGPWRHWAVTVEWRTPQGEDASRVLRVLDTRSGLCLCEASGETVTLWPVNATRVWRRLTLLLPNEVDDA